VARRKGGIMSFNKFRKYFGNISEIPPNSTGVNKKLIEKMGKGPETHYILARFGEIKLGGQNE